MTARKRKNSLSHGEAPLLVFQHRVFSPETIQPKQTHQMAFLYICADPCICMYVTIMLKEAINLRVCGVTQKGFEGSVARKDWIE